MQEKYTLNTALAAVVGLGCLAAVLYRVFLSAAVLPAVGLPAAAACSLLALAAEAYLSKGVPRRNWGLTLLLGALTFGLLPWAAGLTAGARLYTVAIFGTAVLGLVYILMNYARKEKRVFLLILRYATEVDAAVAALLTPLKGKLKNKSCRNGLTELTLEVRLKNSRTVFLETLAAAPGVETATLVEYNGDYV